MMHKLSLESTMGDHSYNNLPPRIRSDRSSRDRSQNIDFNPVVRGRIASFSSENQKLTELHKPDREDEQLVRGVVHDVNNLLAIAVGHGSIALSKLPEGSPAAQYLDRAVRAALRAAELSRLLLDRIVRDQAPCVRLNLNHIVTDFVELLELWASDDVVIESRLDAKIGPIWANTPQLQQVVMNLLVNAIESLNDQPGHIQIETRRVTLSANDLRDYTSEQPLEASDYVMLEISDTGIGMDSAVVTRIFEPFFTTKDEGSGIGLSSVLQIVEVLSGGIRVESVPDQGTVFQIVFPETE